MTHLQSAVATLSGPPQGASVQAPCMHSPLCWDPGGCLHPMECVQAFDNVHAALGLVLLDQCNADWTCVMQKMTCAAGHAPERPARLLHLHAAADESRACPAAQHSPWSCSPLLPSQPGS